MKTISYYSEAFGRLHTNVCRGHRAPHKALLLLSVIDLIERGVVSSPRIELSDSLIATFNRNSKRYFVNRSRFKPEIGKPFFHMQSEPFWRLIPASAVSASPVSLAAEPSLPIPTAKLPKAVYSISGLREAFSCAVIDPELFTLLQDHDSRVLLRTQLISTYLSAQSSLFLPSAALPLALAFLAI